MNKTGLILKNFTILLLNMIIITSFAQSGMPDIKGWLDDRYYLEERISDDGKTQIWKVDAKTGKSKIYRKVLLKDEINEALPEGFAIGYYTISTDDYKSNIFRKENDLYYYSHPTKEFKRLTENPDEEKNPTFSPDETKIAFTRNNDLYVLNIESGKEKRLTHDGSDLILNGYSSWVYWEEIHGRGTRFKTFWWSPDGSMIAFERFDDNPVPEFYLFNPDGIHGELEIQRYPKVGDPNPGVKLGVIHLASGETTWIDSNDDEDVYIAWPKWAPDSKTLLYQRLNRDQNDLEIIAADPFNGNKKTVYNEKQETWVDFFEDMYIFENGSGFILRSNKDGWRNLYYYNSEGNLIARLTDANWRVNSIEKVDEENGIVWFMGTGDTSINNHLYKVKLDGSEFEQLTTKSASHRVDISDEGSWFIDTYYNIFTPRNMQLAAGDGTIKRKFSDNNAPEKGKEGLCKVEYFTIPTEDGFDLPAYWVLPNDFNPDEKYGVVFTVYGGPNSKNIRNRYVNPKGNTFTKNGIIQFVVDHRASGHFGKKGLDYIYRNMGKWDLDDYITAAKWLKKQPFVDSTKIGITGGSYGGYMAALALTRGADHFTCGVASFAVTDFRLYDNIYTERYMDDNEVNKEGYDYGSVMTHADKLKGKLYILHGTMDDNVHMQHILQLVDKLTDLNKDFELMIYPKGRHGWGAPKWYHSSRETREFLIEHLGKEKEEE